MLTNTANQDHYRLVADGFFEKQIPDMVAEPTKDTPFVKYSRSENLFMVKGRSVRQDVHHFYDPFMAELKVHLNEGKDLDLVMFFTMINTSTTKVFFDLFRFIHRKQAEGSKVNVTWCSEEVNTEMQETGQDFAGVYNLDFKFLTI